MKKICISKDWLFSSRENPERVKIDLPHDYSISLPRDPKSAGWASNGYFCGTYGKYVKYMNMGNYEHAILDIDGAYMCSRVYFNDNQVAFHPYGYTPFLVDLTPKMRKNRSNKIAIDTHNLQPSTRWYSGSGIYRDVFLWTGGKVRIEPWNVFIKTLSAEKETATVLATIKITSDIEAEIILNTSIADKDGKHAADLKETMVVSAGENVREFTYKIDNPELWDTENPYLYKFEAEIILNEKIEDSYDLNFGA